MDAQRIKKSIYRSVSEYFSFNKTEQRGIAVLLLILGLVIVANLTIPARIAMPDADLKTLQQEAALFEAAWQAAADSDSIARVSKYNDRPSGQNVQHRFPPGASIVYTTPSVMVELNSADTLDLQQLKGIGPAFARRIVGYRVRLHGFFEPEQLLEIFGIDSSRYAMLKPFVIVNRDSVKSFDLNKVPFKDLLRHPYFPFPVAKNIIRYRSEQNGFKSVDELREVPGVTDSLFRRMVPYLRLGP